MNGECVCITIIIRTNAENVFDKIPTAAISDAMKQSLAEALAATPTVKELAGCVVEMKLDLLMGVAHVGTA